jgi:hypothetical protein
MLNNTERRGFAIPVAILVIAVLTIMLAGGFSIVSAERRSVADQKSQVSAFRIAEQGLELFLVRRDSLLSARAGYSKVPGAQDTIRVALAGGYADVQLTMLRPPTGTQSGLYILRSRGTETANVYGGAPAGVRTVAQYVLWEPMPMQVLAGWLALSGLQKNGGAGTLSGVDLCHDSDAVAGVVVPLNPGYLGSTAATEGSPAIDTVTADSVHIDWMGIVTNNLIQATITIPGGSFPPDAAFNDTTYYPIIRVNGNLDLPLSGGTVGRGMLIVTGNFVISGNASWKGVVLVGGTITSNGGNGIYGATVSGLNVKMVPPIPVPPSTANGTKTYEYNSCEVAKANMSSGALVTLKNTWVDNWVQY